MIKFLTVSISLLFFNAFAMGQNYTHFYNLDKNIVAVKNDSATFIGKGYKDGSVFLLDVFDKKSNARIMSLHYSDSSLNNLHGLFKYYFHMGQIMHEGNYINKVKEGMWLHRDTAGAILDTFIYEKGLPISNKKSDSTQQITTEIIKNINKNKDADYILFYRVEVEAEYPGGIGAFRDYLSKNLDADVPANKNAPAGTYTVIVRFIVDKDGSVSDITPETNYGYGMETEIMRVIQNSKKWLPAKQNNVIVKAYRRQPVTFVIENERKKRRK